MHHQGYVLVGHPDTQYAIIDTGHGDLKSRRGQSRAVYGRAS
jgi:hypothetical protein